MTSILIVDDETRKIRAVAQFLVDDCGFLDSDIASANDAQQARVLLKERKFDVLLLDLVLPNNSKSEPSERSSIDLLIDLSERDGYFKPGRIIGFTAYDELSPAVADAFRERMWTIIKYRQDSNEWQGPIRKSIEYISAVHRQAPSQEYDFDICIITALANPELSAVKRLPWNWEADFPVDDNTWACTGSFALSGEKIKVAAMSAPRMGLVSSALLSAKAIHYFRPRFLAMAGICAGVESKTKIGDVLVANPSWNWQSGKHSASELGPHFNAAPHALPLPEFLRSRIGQIGSDRSSLAAIKGDYQAATPSDELTVRCGPVASGSAVVADADVLAPLLEVDRAMIGLEMEIYGMYAAAVDAGFPRPSAIAFKSVCDFGTKEKNDAHQTYAAHTSARVMQLFFERYIVEIKKYAGTV